MLWLLYIMSASYISKFYKQLDDFKNKLVIILKSLDKDKEIIELNKYYDQIITFKQINARKPIELIYVYGISKIAEHIVSHDDNYFFSVASDVNQMIDLVGNDADTEGATDLLHKVSNNDLLFIGQIKDQWVNLSSQSRKNIWAYIEVISELAERVVGGNALCNARKKLVK